MRTTTLTLLAAALAAAGSDGLGRRCGVDAPAGAGQDPAGAHGRHQPGDAELHRQAPLNPDWNFHPKTGEEWRAMADKIAAGVVPGLPAMQERLHVKVDIRRSTALRSTSSRPTTSRPPTPTR